MAVQDLSQTFFYSENKKIFLTHFQPTPHSYAPRKYEKTFDFLMFLVGISGFQVKYWLQMG